MSKATQRDVDQSLENAVMNGYDMMSVPDLDSARSLFATEPEIFGETLIVEIVRMVQDWKRRKQN